MRATAMMNLIPHTSSSIFLPPPTSINFPFSLRLATLAPILCSPNPSAAASPSQSTSQIEMFLNPATGVYSPRQQKVVVLWDLDNKPPRGPPYAAALALRRLAELFGSVDAISAYANCHAFTHLPQWVLDQRRQQRGQDLLERKGLAVPADPYVCGVCGRKCRTNLDLKKHFKQLHERERQKKVARMRSLKGKKRQKYRERFISNNFKYEEAARQLLTPKSGYGLAAELRRAGVFVKTVEDKPQAADWAVKRQMQHSVARGVDWLLLVSDDSDFSEMIRKARESDLRTVVVGDGRTALGRHADLWIPWARVESGQVGEEVLRAGRRDDEEGDQGAFVSAKFYEGGDVDDELEVAAEEIAVRSSARLGGGVGPIRMSAFSEEDVENGAIEREDFEDEFRGIFESVMSDGDLLSDSEEEDDFYI